MNGVSLKVFDQQKITSLENTFWPKIFYSFTLRLPQIFSYNYCKPQNRNRYLNTTSVWEKLRC